MEPSTQQGQGKGANPASGSAGAVPPPQRSPSQSSLHRSGHAASHRQSFAENLRNPPPSPRAHRVSFTQQAVQDLLNHPPATRQANPRFSGRDWRDVAVGELVSQDDVKWVTMETSVEEATKVLLRNHGVDVVLIRGQPGNDAQASTFDYNDLNSYLLVVVGLAKPDEQNLALFDSIAKRAQERVSIPLRDIQPLCRKELLITLPADQNLAHAVEVLGSGIHRILVTDSSSQVVGILSQLTLLEFFWNEGVNFPTIDRLYPLPLRDLQIGSQQIIAINADSPLADALILMNDEGLTSVAVVDNGLNVTGNISTVDIKHLTSAASLPLLQSTCMHFISVILSERGVEQGKDPFPVFHVNPYSTLAHTVAKLVATHSHRMWVVESASPSPSAPATPLLGPVSVSASGSTTGTTNTASTTGTTRETTVLVPPPTGAPQSPTTLPSGVAPSFASVPAAALPGAHLSGRLTGVVSLTDVLNLFAKSSGLHPSDPGEQRARRRRSSSSSVRPSLDASRTSSDVRR